MPTPVFKYQLLSYLAYPPTRATRDSAGVDLRSAYTYTIPSGSNCVVHTDLRIQLPHHCYGRIASRSGLALRYGITTEAGVIDPDYRGNIIVLLYNRSRFPTRIERGVRVAQLICENFISPELVETDHIAETERGNDGFGSSGN